MSRTTITRDQLHAIERLRSQKPQATAVILAGLKYRNLPDLRSVSYTDATKLISKLMTLEANSAQTRADSSQKIEDGIYKKDGVIFKVVTSPNSGRKYAKKANVINRPNGYKIEWDYAPGVIKTLTEENKIKKEDAQEFGQLYGICVRCGRILTAEDSIERMMGPICYGKMGF